MRSLVVTIGIGLASLLLVAGCTAGGTETVEEVVDAPVTPEVTSESVTLPELPEGSTARGVVLASVLLTGGDITRAVEEGLVTLEEVELAREAIESGTLQAWIDEAGAGE